MSFTRRTMKDLVTEVRSYLDEPFNAATNYWSNSELVRWLNRGMQETYQTVREAHENWFLRTITSEDEPFAILGEKFLPSSLGLTAGATEMRLPPDFVELRSFIAKDSASADLPVGGPVFEFVNMSSPLYKDARRNTGDGTESTAQFWGGYMCDVVWREDGAFITFAPAIGVSERRETILDYIRGIPPVKYLDSLETLGFTEPMLTAVIAYAVREARTKEGDGQRISLANSLWDAKRTVALRGAGPRQSADPVYVQGYLEEELG